MSAPPVSHQLRMVTILHGQMVLEQMEQGPDVEKFT